MGNIGGPHLAARQGAVIDGWCKRLASAKGSAGLVPQWLAVSEGLRPAMDDWVPRSMLGEVSRIASERGLHVLPDVAFRPIASLAGVRGAARLTTTVTAGIWWREAGDLDRVHVFVGSDEARAREAARWGWYPVIVGSSVVSADPADARAFGLALGYPTCCVEAFLTHNLWDGLGHFHRLGLAEQRPFLLNFLGRHHGWSWLFHVPCRWTCEASMQLARATRAAMTRMDQEWVSWADGLACGRFVVISELSVYRLDPTTYLGISGGDRWSQTLTRGEVRVDARGRVEVDAATGTVSLHTRSIGHAAEHAMLWTFGKEC